jgi:hypothetical protein
MELTGHSDMRDIDEDSGPAKQGPVERIPDHQRIPLVLQNRLYGLLGGERQDPVALKRRDRHEGTTDMNRYPVIVLKTSPERHCGNLLPYQKSGGLS